MAKRGEQRPWKVIYQYEGRPEYREAWNSRDRAESKAREIRDWAERMGLSVTVRIEMKG